MDRHQRRDTSPTVGLKRIVGIGFDVVKWMDKRPTPIVMVTTPQGGLLGVVRREEATRILSGESPEMVWAECEGCPGLWRPTN